MQDKSQDRLENGAELSRSRIVAYFALFWERFWPLALPVLIVVALFLTVSWLGVWPLLNNWVRIGGVALFALAALAALYPLRLFSFPSTEEINSRIERSSALEHRPVTAQVDARSDLAGQDDPFARALWEEHRRRMAGKLNNLKVGTPVPKIAAKDPFAMRALVGLLLFIGLAAGWGNWSSRVGDAFRTHLVAKADTSRIDAWVTPPAYTNRPPIFLKRSNGETARTITVPEGSEFVVRVLDLNEPMITLLQNGKETPVAPAENPDAAKSGIAEPDDLVASGSTTTYKTKLGESASALLRSGKDTVEQWRFKIIPDDAPEISFEEGPDGSNRGTLEFAFNVKDDYGVVSATAEIKSASPQSGTAVPLIKAPELNLPLPRRRAKKGSAKTSEDLTNHPWAGAKVAMTLFAEDDAGQKGQSETKTFTLPERIFTKPLALAVVEERRNLALNANAAPQVAEMLDIITTTHPDEFIKDKAVYTGLRVAYRTISRTKDHERLREAVDMLWEIALSIEDGNLSRAEKRLRDAMERLADALENGASEEEIAKLMEELRQAMNEFTQELAEQMQKNQQAMPMDPNAQVLRQQDLDQLMKQIEDLAKSGSKDAARQLLEELQRMMNNLQTAQPQGQQQQSDEFSEQMNKLGDMMRQQQQLMDKTFEMQRRQQQQRQGQNGEQKQGEQQQNQQGQQGKQGQQGDQKPMTEQELADALRELQRQQGELQKQMGQMQKDLEALGMDPGKLGEAGEAMGGAEQQLGDGNTGEATGEQGRALQAMREGAQQMMQAMQNQPGEQGRRGERGQHGQQSRGDRDPLGRASRSRGPELGDKTKIPGEIDAQRAREILETIRRKLGESTRPKLELDYLDRLLPTR